jgi:hypothetical protein
MMSKKRKGVEEVTMLLTRLKVPVIKKGLHRKDQVLGSCPVSAQASRAWYTFTTHAHMYIKCPPKFLVGYPLNVIIIVISLSGIFICCLIYCVLLIRSLPPRRIEVTRKLGKTPYLKRYQRERCKEIHCEI